MIPTFESLAGVKDVCRRRQEETVNILQSAVSVSLSSLTILLLCDRHVDRQFKRPPAYRYPTAFFSASAIVTKSTLRKAILNFVCFYFMVITIVVILLFLLMFFFCFLSADDYLNAKKTT